MLGGGPGLRLMRIRGVDVFLDFSVLLMMAFIILPITQGLSQTEALSGGEVWTIALSIGVLFVVSILIHELSHAFVGILLGAKVAGIRLFVFGGATYFSSKPTSEGKNFWISVAGPLANLALWGVFNFLYHNTTAPVWEAVFFYMQYANILLAGFNALPGYPMDGGQAVRSAIIWLTKKELLASQIVMVLGCLTGGLIGFWAVQGILAHDNIGFFFRVYIAFWIISGSINQYRSMEQIQPVNRPQPVRPVEPRAAIGVPVGQIMSRPVQAFTLDTSVAEFLAQTNEARLDDQSWLPVLREGYLMGAMNRQIARRVPGTEQAQRHLEQAMLARRQLFALNVDQDLSAAVEMLQNSKDAPVAVLGAGGLFAGFLTRENLKQSA